MNNNNGQKQEPIEESVRIKKELYHVEFNLGKITTALIILVGMGLSITTICPKLGATPDQVKEMLQVGVPMVAIGTPVGLYKIRRALSRRKELKEELNKIGNDSQTER